MKYSLMSLMVDTELKLMKPNFIHMSILKDMGYEGNDPTIDEVFEFLNAHGVPMKNGTMTFEDLVKLAKDCGYDGLDLMSFHFELPGAEAKEILDKYGIVLSAVNLIIPFANASTEEKYQVMLSRAKATIDQTSEAGCRNMLLMPTVYALDEGITMEQSFHYLTRGLKECVAYGKSRGVVINTETLETAGVSYCTCGEMKRIFDEVEDLKLTGMCSRYSRELTGINMLTVSSFFMRTAQSRSDYVPDLLRKKKQKKQGSLRSVDW